MEIETTRTLVGIGSFGVLVSTGYFIYQQNRQKKLDLAMVVKTVIPFMLLSTMGNEIVKEAFPGVTLWQAIKYTYPAIFMYAVLPPTIVALGGYIVYRMWKAKA